MQPLVCPLSSLPHIISTHNHGRDLDKMPASFALQEEDLAAAAWERSQPAAAPPAATQPGQSAAPPQAPAILRRVDDVKGEASRRMDGAEPPPVRPRRRPCVSACPPSPPAAPGTGYLGAFTCAAIVDAPAEEVLRFLSTPSDFPKVYSAIQVGAEEAGRRAAGTGRQGKEGRPASSCIPTCIASSGSPALSCSPACHPTHRAWRRWVLPPPVAPSPL